MIISTPDRDVKSLHYKARVSADALLKDLLGAYRTKQTQFRFELFEGFRSPQRQIKMLADGVSKAREWQSPHQYGLAIDVVPRCVRRQDGSEKEGWTWTETTSWAFLHAFASSYGWTAPISWDKPHLVHPLWNDIRRFVV